MEAYYYGQIQLATKRRQEEYQKNISKCVNRNSVAQSRTTSGSSIVSSVSRSSIQSNTSISETTPLTKNYSTVYNSAYDINSLD